MSEKLIGQAQQRRRRGIVDTINGTGQNLNLIQSNLDPSSLMMDNGNLTPSSGGGSNSGGTGNNTGSTSSSTSSGSCLNPGSAALTQTGSASDGTTTTQLFSVGQSVNPGFVYQCGVYSVVISVTAIDGDTQASIAAKLAAAINNTPLSTWNQYGSNNHNYKPTATSSGSILTTHCDYQHSFFGSATGSCTADVQPPPPPPPPADPAFPYDQFQIDAMDCSTITGAALQVQQTMQANNYTSWQTMYDYMIQRMKAVCATSPAPVQGDPSFPYTKDQIDGMECSLLQTTIVSVQQQIAEHGYTTWNDMLQYMQQRATTVCAVSQTTDAPPMTPVPGITTPQVIPFPIYSGGGGGGGGSSSGTKTLPQTKGKTYLWAAIAAGSVLAYFTFAGGSIVKV